MKIAITETASFNFGINELVITKDELFALIARELGHSESDQRLDGYDDDYIIHRIVYGDKNDEKLLKIIKNRLEKSKADLKPVYYEDKRTL